MKTREQRQKELIDSGLVSSIKQQYNGIQNNITDEYFILITDYIDSISQIDNFKVDYVALAKILPKLLNSVQEQNLGGLHGRTDGTSITMNTNMSYEQKKLFFFHELTHALQTRTVDGKNQCGFYDGNSGMFFTEGATQFTAEILYHISNETNFYYRDQPNVITGQPNHTLESPLSQYQFNGNILYMFSQVTKIPLNELLTLGFNPNGRSILKQKYEEIEDNEGKFEEFMFDLEKIYAIEKISWCGHFAEMNSQTPSKCQFENGVVFDGNFSIQNELMSKVEQDLLASFFQNDENYIFNNYQKMLKCLTTQNLKNLFLSAVNELYHIVHLQEQSQPDSRGR